MRAVPEIDGVCVTRDGRVFRERDGALREVPIARSSTGYLTAPVLVAGKRRKEYVHRLVLMAWVGPPPAGAVTRHLDGNQLNNNVENLAWGTIKENADDARRLGELAIGARNSHARLTDEQVMEIRAHRGRVRNDALAKQFGVTTKTIEDIVYGRRWKHLPVPSRVRYGPGVRLTDVQVREIRQRRASGETVKGLAREYGISPRRVRDVVEQRTERYRDVGEAVSD